MWAIGYRLAHFSGMVTFMNTPDNTLFEDQTNANARSSAKLIQKLGGAASLLMAVAIVAAHWIYLTGNLDEPAGPFIYASADLLYGAVFGAGLVAAVYALRERIGERAPRLMTLSLLLALAAACAFLTVASIRSANRYYHLTHPGLNLQSSSTVLVVWATLVSGIIGAAFHFLGWSLLMIGLAGWTTRRLPHVLSGLYLIGGMVALVVYLLPSAEETALLLVLVISIWQGVLLWRAGPARQPAPEITA